MNSYSIPELKSQYDVVVAGAGIAGISASVKAAREGVSVLLVEHYGFPGGMSTAGMVSPFMKHSVNGVPLVRGVFEDLENEMRSRNGMIDNGFYGSSFRAAAINLLAASDCTVLFHSEVLRVNRNGNRITSLTVLVNGKETVISGKIFIDTTGDAMLLYLGKFPWVKGDEKTGNLQAITLFFRMGNIDIGEVTEYAKANRENFFGWMDYNFNFSRIISVAGFFDQVNKAKRDKRLQEDVQYIFFTTLPETGEGSFNTTNILGLDASTSYDLTSAEIEGRRQVRQVVKLLQEEIPGFDNAMLLETAVQAGVRETRRAVGEYAISGEDIRMGKKFNDAIARGSYGIDIHGQKDEESRMEYLKEGDYYEIPVRALIVKEADNLLVAGRCISSTREGHSALRIQPTSAATGEACGALAVLSIKQAAGLREVKISELQKKISHNLTRKT
jgi:hypothetical protein